MSLFRVCACTGGCPPSAPGGEGVPPLQKEPADLRADRGEKHSARRDHRPQRYAGRQGTQS